MKIAVVLAALCALSGAGLGCATTENDGVLQGAAGAGGASTLGGSGGMAASAAGSAGTTPVNPMAGAGGARAGSGGTVAMTAGSGGAASGSGGASGGMGGMGGAAGSAGGGAMACTGKPGALRGKSNQTVMAGGASRTFVYYAPMTLNPNVAVPFVIVPHGYTMSGQQMFDITGYDKIADREGFVVAYPDGAGSPGPWNVGTNVCGVGNLVTASTNDQALVDELMKFVEADQCLDRGHVFMTGFSMGGYFSNETGCLRSEVKAVGPHSGGTHDLAACPAPPKPVILFHGDADGLIVPMCGMEARQRWAQKNGCGTEVEVRMVENGMCEYSKNCPPGAQVALCLFSGMDHGWAGGSDGQAFSFPGYESASELGWKFFKEFAW